MQFFGITLGSWILIIIGAIALCMMLTSFMRSMYKKILRFKIAHTNNQKVLFDIVSTQSDYHIQRAALEKLTDQSLLAELVSRYVGVGIQEDALKKLTDQALLLHSIRQSEPCYTEVCKKAFHKITDPAIAEQAFQEILDVYLKGQKHENGILKYPDSFLSFVAQHISSYPQIIAQYWPIIKQTALVSHTDRTKFSSSTDCHNDSGIHTDMYGKKYLDRFPPYVTKE